MEQAQPADRTLVADWSFVFMRSRWPIIRIYSDGSVEMSGDLWLGGHPLTTQHLSRAQFAEFGARIDRLCDGLEGITLDFAIEYKQPYHEISITREGRALALRTSMRLVERRALESTLWGPDFGPTWMKFLGGNRYEKLFELDARYVAMREMWLELEAELLRVAAESLLPDQEGAVNSSFGHKGVRDGEDSQGAKP